MNSTLCCLAADIRATSCSGRRIRDEKGNLTKTYRSPSWCLFWHALGEVLVLIGQTLNHHCPSVCKMIRCIQLTMERLQTEQLNNVSGDNDVSERDCKNDHIPCVFKCFILFLFVQFVTSTLHSCEWGSWWQHVLHDLTTGAVQDVFSFSFNQED